MSTVVHNEKIRSVVSIMVHDEFARFEMQLGFGFRLLTV